MWEEGEIMKNTVKFEELTIAQVKELVEIALEKTSENPETEKKYNPKYKGYESRVYIEDGSKHDTLQLILVDWSDKYGCYIRTRVMWNSNSNSFMAIPDRGWNTYSDCLYIVHRDAIFKCDEALFLILKGALLSVVMQYSKFTANLVKECKYYLKESTPDCIKEFIYSVIEQIKANHDRDKISIR